MIRIPHLETDITSACQLSCVACNHHVPLYRALSGTPQSADPEQVWRDVARLSLILHADRWGALGGEPTLHAKLVDILKIVRDSEIADALEVWTNGLTIRRLKPEFWRAFDVLVLSVYPGKHNAASLDWIAKKCEDERVELVVKDEGVHPNFMTLLEPVPTDKTATRKKFAGCFFRHFSRVVNDGYFFTCCCAPHMPVLIQERPFGSDGVSLDGLTEDGLRAYLSREEPLGACSICAGRDTAQRVEWHEEKDPAKWLVASAGVLP